LSYRCPVCKARLWRPMFARRLRCPRCGAEVEPSVPLAYVQLVLALTALVVVLALGVTDPRLWLGGTLVILILFLLFWLPRMVHLQPTDHLPATEGHPADLRLNLADEENEPEEPKEVSFFWFYLSLCGLVLLLALALLLRRIHW
ncbi:MAG TPA: hypothetical protein P5300_12465, partial [Acidobacteriota bacterium]|nr:hypothetical protein [Acidobacteriota bacterium]